MPEEQLERLDEPPRVSSCCDSQISLNDSNSSSDSEFYDPIDDEDDYVVVVDDDGDVDDDDSSHCHSIDNSDSKKDALQELRDKVEDAIISNSIFGTKYRIDIVENLSNVEIWGVPLLPSKGHEGTDIVLMKFLKAKHYVVSEAFRMLRKTMKWRRGLKIDESFDEEFEEGLESMWNMQGKDHEGRPVCYCMLGEFKDNRGVRDECLSSNEQSSNYMRWRLLCLERAVREIGFRQGESNSIIQIIDLKNAHSKSIKECNNSINRKLMSLVHEYYPGLVHKNLFINVSVWYLAVNALNMKLITKKTKKKYCFVRSTKVTETLLKLLPPEHLPVQYGGLLRENDDEFSTDDKVLEAYASGNYITRIKIPVKKVDVTLIWDLTVVGFNVIYKEEFIPDDDCSYEVLIQDKRKMVATLRNSFHIREPGSIIITIENPTYKKRPVFYRHKFKPSIPFYLMSKAMTRMD